MPFPADWFCCTEDRVIKAFPFQKDLIFSSIVLQSVKYNH